MLRAFLVAVVVVVVWVRPHDAAAADSAVVPDRGQLTVSAGLGIPAGRLQEGELSGARIFTLRFGFGAAF